MSIIKAPSFRVIRKGRAGRWRLVDSMRYGWVAKNCVVEVPAATETDLASIPVPFRNIFSINGRHRLPAVLHDYLYSKAGCIEITHSYSVVEGDVEKLHPGVIEYSRKEADQVFYKAMREEGVGPIKAAMMYRAVRIFGGLHIKRSGGKEWY